MLLLSRVFALCLATALLSGQTPAPRDPFTAARPAVLAAGDAALAGATVYDAMVDHQGRLWATTQEGVFRLEGGEWKPLPLPTGLPSLHVRTLLEAQDGALWLGTETSGILRLANGVWTVWDKNRGLPSSRINHLAELPDAAGIPEIWASTGSGGALRLRLLLVGRRLASPAAEGDGLGVRLFDVGLVGGLAVRLLA